MKRIIVMLLLVCVLLATGCDRNNSPHQSMLPDADTQNVYVRSATDNAADKLLTAEDAVFLLDSIRNADWESGVAECISICDYIVTIEGSELHYHSYCGNFFDPEGNRSFSLEESQNGCINRILQINTESASISIKASLDSEEFQYLSLEKDNEIHKYRLIDTVNSMYYSVKPGELILTFEQKFNKSNIYSVYTDKALTDLSALIVYSNEGKSWYFVDESVKSRNLAYDPHIVSRDTVEYLGDLLPLYHKMIDCILSYKDTISGFASKEDAWKVWGAVISEFLPSQYMLHNFGTHQEPFMYADGTFTLLFRNSKKEHERIYFAFTERINKALNLLDFNPAADPMGDMEILYMYVCNNMDYYFGASTSYDVIVQGKGICGDYADYLILLAMQAGIETMKIGCNAVDGFELDHAWMIACIKGKWYHFDACWQDARDCDSRDDFVYFAMSDDYRIGTLDNYLGQRGKVILNYINKYKGRSTSPFPICDDTTYDQKKVK